jgi:hypothetical protein
VHPGHGIALVQVKAVGEGGQVLGRLTEQQRSAC